MRIRSNFYVSVDGYVSTADGRPVQLVLDTFKGADSHGLPDFLATVEAVVMGRTTFLPALGAPRWPWTQPVFVLTSSPLPDETPDDVTSAPHVPALIERMEAAGISGDVHVVGPSTMRAFHDANALHGLSIHLVPRLLGAGTPLSPPGSEPLSLELESSRPFPDGVVELQYAIQ